VWVCCEDGLAWPNGWQADFGQHAVKGGGTREGARQGSTMKEFEELMREVSRGKSALWRVRVFLAWLVITAAAAPELMKEVFRRRWALWSGKTRRSYEEV